MRYEIIDAHAHCGIQDTSPPQSLEDYLDAAKGSGITAAVFFPPVMEIYDRYQFHFQDSPQWRQRRERANRYLEALDHPDFQVYPFFFIWNDFAVEQLTSRHKGIKWHRHGDEPMYRYEDPRCTAAIEEIRRRNMPVTLEEEWHFTLRFIHQLAAGVRVIIPHCGLLNGGYEAFCRHGIWQLPNIYADTALAPPSVIEDYLRRYGPDRIFFGSDFPFGDPPSEARKILNLRISEGEKARVLAGNIKRLLAESNPA
ncbi:MAG: amidohydrolase family protein [Deltaproteobacteria bacterium]|nr:amidohydrolase family protein [Deltaproteobacteria bacterium]